jgi:hypothetical protein
VLLVDGQPGMGQLSASSITSAGELVCLFPQRRRLVVAALGPAPGQSCEVRQEDFAACCGDHLQFPSLRPENERGAVISALEAGAGVTRGFEKLLIVGLFVVERSGWAEFLIGERQIGELGPAAVGRLPFGERQRALEISPTSKSSSSSSA